MGKIVIEASILLVLLVAAMVAADDATGPKPPVVLGVPLGEERSKVEAMFQAANIPQLDRDNHATLYKEPVAKLKDAGRTAVFFSNGRLAKVVTFFDIESSSADRYLARYSELKTNLTEKYGKPHNSFEHIDDTYRDEPLLAIKTGKGRFVSQWETPAVDISLGLYGDNYKVSFMLQYEHRELTEKYEKDRQADEKGAL